MRYRVLFFCFCCLLAVPTGCFGTTPLEVRVEGVDGQLYQNIMARLRIHLFSRDSELSEAEIRRLHRLAEEDIESALAPYGYYTAEVDGVLQKSEAGWQAAYLVEPGRQVTVVSFDVFVEGAGENQPELAEPEKLFSLKESGPLNHPAYEEGKKRLLRQARSLGYLDAAFSVHEIRINRERAEAEIELVLDTGSRYLFGEVKSEQEVIDEDLLARFIPFSKGDFFKPSLLYELQRELYRTDYFSSVAIDPETSATDGLHVPVNLALAPLEHYNRYSFGIGYATDTRAHVRFEWLNKLLNRQGHRVFSSFLIGERETRCVINYRVPVADPRFNTLAATTLWNRELWEDTITNRVSAGLIYEYSTPVFHAGLSVEGLEEDFRVGNTRGTSQLLIPGLQGSFALADNIVKTENGIRVAFEITGASENLLSDASFVKIRGDGKLIITPVDGWRLIGSGSAGAILVDAIDDIPPSIRFYAGGENSVRGYRYRTLGPTDSSGAVIGGRYLLTGSIECEKKLSELWRLSAFYDVGNAMDDLSVDLVSGIGISVGLSLPFGQASMALAYPLHDEGSSQIFFLSVGADL